MDPDRYVAALRFAAEAHRDQLVPGNGLPYVVHLVSVANEIRTAAAADDDLDLAMCAALLHDTIEDTQTTYADVVAAFGPRIADGVQALSKDPTLAKGDAMADSLRRIRLQPREIWMVKLADRITNLSPPPAKWDAAKRAAYRAEAIVIADALGSASPVLETRIRAKIEAYRSHC